MSRPRDGKRPTLVGASAGSGKTHRLTEEVVRAVASTDVEAIAPESLVAVTYTRRAAAELGARIRRKLVENGAHERALKLPLAYLGTVHAVCLRLVQEFAIDSGLSPHVDVLPGDEGRWLGEALEWGLPRHLRGTIDSFATRLQLRLDPRRKRMDWLTPVQDIMTLARSNRIPPASLPAMAERSSNRLLALLGPAERDGEALDRELLMALERAYLELEKVDDGRAKTRTAHAVIEEVLRAFREGSVVWSDWVRLQKLEPAKGAVPLVAPVIDIACRVDRHPRLQADIRSSTAALYEAARIGLEVYDAWKKRRRVVDFVDMVDRALTLMENLEVQDELGERLRLLVVDEFQDTSPLQLALFVRLHQLAGRSTWVGDRKQCIFEFAGADPMLMEAVSAWANGPGGEANRLQANWRSRPELVDACSHLFAAAFHRHGYRREEVVVHATRTTPPELANLPPLGLWSLDAGNRDLAARAIAEGVRRLIEGAAATPVVDRATGVVRSLRPGDIAVLVATNAESDSLAAALGLHGVRATVSRAGLLATPEGTLVQAALSTLLDPRDTLSSATMEALTGFGGQDPDAWLDARVAAEASRRDARARGVVPEPTAPLASSACLDPLRAQLDALAPSEALDGVLSALDLASRCARWPNPTQRLSNLDALRALTATYEERCGQQREAATIAGLLRYFAEAAQTRFVRDEEIASDDQHVGAGENAVTIVTYHRAKGLEWPVVILSSLDRGERRDAFEVSPETDRVAFDPDDPLGGRWIRYWPWPYGQQQKARLAIAAEASTEGKAVALREERERVRLLYVGFTRARDHLILAARLTSKGHAVQWLDELSDDKAEPLVHLPDAAEASGTSIMSLRGPGDELLRVRVRHWTLSAADDAPARLPSHDAHVWFARPDEAPPMPPAYWIAPSQARGGASASSIPGATDLVAIGASSIPGATDVASMGASSISGATDVVSIGDRLPLGDAPGAAWDIVGDAIHAFFAADVPELTTPQRIDRARRLLLADGLGALLTPQALLVAGDQLRAWVEFRWPDAVWHREYPVTGAFATPSGTCRVRGTIDLLLEVNEGVVIIDHKSFPGGERQRAEKAREFAPQLAVYAQVVRAAGRPVVGTYVHFPIGASVARVG